MNPDQKRKKNIGSNEKLLQTVFKGSDTPKKVGKSSLDIVEKKFEKKSSFFLMAKSEQNEKIEDRENNEEVINLQNFPVEIPNSTLIPPEFQEII